MQPGRVDGQVILFCSEVLNGVAQGRFDRLKANGQEGKDYDSCTNKGEYLPLDRDAVCVVEKPLTHPVPHERTGDEDGDGNRFEVAPMIAVIAIGSQAVKAALANPVGSLRSE